MSDLNAYFGEFDSRAYIFSDNKTHNNIQKESSGQKQLTSSSKVRDNTLN